VASGNQQTLKTKKLTNNCKRKRRHRASKASAIPNAMFKEILSPIALRKPKMYRFDRQLLINEFSFSGPCMTKAT
jgi:hypothetical protein